MNVAWQAETEPIKLRIHIPSLPKDSVMRNILKTLILALPLLTPTAFADQGDPRLAVKMPAMMQAHMRANMRDHLLAVHEMQTALAQGNFDNAAAIAEKRLGMTSLESHGASHMAGLMPEEMRTTGTAMHKAASRFAVTAQEAAVTQDLARTLGALADVTANCVAYHAGYKLN